MKLTALTAVALTAIALAGCAPSTEDAYTTARAACVKLYEDAADAMRSRLVDPSELLTPAEYCDGAEETQGREHFTELFNDPAFLKRYLEAQTS